VSAQHPKRAIFDYLNPNLYFRVLCMLGALLIIGGSFIIGFTVGFGVRETISRRRRRKHSGVIVW
jgi:hypothetical protein